MFCFLTTKDKKIFWEVKKNIVLKISILILPPFSLDRFFSDRQISLIRQILAGFLQTGLSTLHSIRLQYIDKEALTLTIQNIL